jgi:hypothetical protein
MHGINLQTVKIFIAYSIYAIIGFKNSFKRFADRVDMNGHIYLDNSISIYPLSTTYTNWTCHNRMSPTSSALYEKVFNFVYAPNIIYHGQTALFRKKFAEVVLVHIFISL